MADAGPFGFQGGYNTKASAYTLPPNQICDGQNVYISYGDLVKMPGSKVINSSAISGTPAIHGLADWQTDAGQRYLVVTAGTKMFQTADLGATLTDITGAVTITTGANNQSTFASLNNIVVRCGGTTPDAPIKWSGTGNAAALGGSPPSGSICTTANNFMFISGVAALPSRIYWSNVIDPSTWGASNYVDLRASDGDKVTALVEMNQNLVIFKRRTMGVLWTNTISVSGAVTLGPLNQVPSAIGVPGPLCVDKLPDGRLIFLGTNAHVYVWDGAMQEDISDPPPPQSNIQPTLDALVPSRLGNAVVRVYPTRSQVWFSVSTGSSTTNNQILVYDYQLAIWLPPVTTRYANVIVASIDTRATPSHPVVLITGNYGGNIYEHDTGLLNPEDTGTNIDGYATTSIVLGPDKIDFVPKSIRVAYEAQTNGQLQFNYNFDDYTGMNISTLLSQNQTGGKLDAFTLDVDTLAGPSTLRKIQPMFGKGKAATVQIQFRNQNGGETFTVHPFQLSEEVLT